MGFFDSVNKRRELYDFIKANGLLGKFSGKNITRISTSDLETVVANYNNMQHEGKHKVEKPASTNSTEKIVINTNNLSDADTAIVVFLSVLKQQGKLDTYLSLIK